MISHETVEQYPLTSEIHRVLLLHIRAVAALGVDFSLTIQKPLTNPLHFLGRRLRIRDQELYHVVQRPFPAPIRSHSLEYLGQRSVGGRDIARYWQCIAV